MLHSDLIIFWFRYVVVIVRKYGNLLQPATMTSHLYVW